MTNVPGCVTIAGNEPIRDYLLRWSGKENTMTNRLFARNAYLDDKHGDTMPVFKDTYAVSYQNKPEWFSCRGVRPIG